MENLKKIKAKPMSDSDIRYYYPKAKIIKYSELKKYNNIEDLLPTIPDFVFILYEDSPENGHWTATTRTKEGINYFDSFGKRVDNPLISWDTPEIVKQRLGENIHYLSKLFNKTKLPVKYNDIDYQIDRQGIETCGRHCCFYTGNMLKHNMSMDKYYRFMKAMRKKYKMTYDEVVSHYIHKI